MNELGVEVTKLREPANHLLRRRHWRVCNCLDFLCQNEMCTYLHMVAQVLHLLKTKEAFLKAQLQALLFEEL
jgi:hypothetical protein